MLTSGSGIRHIDLRVGVLMHRWPWIGSLADAVGAFKARCLEGTVEPSPHVA
jgi:hypothetical protein